MIKQLALLTTLAATCLYAAPLSISQMSESEQKECGIEKLSPEEKHAVDAWLEKQTPAAPAKPALIMHKSKIIHGEFAVTANQELGRYITLDNGLTYEVPSRSRKKTMAWKVGDKVRVIEPVRPVNYKLENIAQSQMIGAKIGKAPLEPRPEK